MFGSRCGSFASGAAYALHFALSGFSEASCVDSLAFHSALIFESDAQILLVGWKICCVLALSVDHDMSAPGGVLVVKGMG